MNHIKIDLERVLSEIDGNIFGGYTDIFWQDPRFEFLDSDDSPRNDI